jgi:type IV pilus assembly protein PilY1
VLTDPARTDQVPPTLSWVLDGGAGSFPRLGETWSQPKLARIETGTTTAGQAVSKTVLIFGGGYDATQDAGFGTGGLGNAIYIVDPSDASRVFWISGTDHVASDGVTVPGMDYPIPSDVALMDSDGDGFTDRLYVGDVGGNVWRVDLRPNETTTAGIKATVGKLATVSDATNTLDQRKFFYKPDVVQAYETGFSNVGRYDLVTINSGNRAHPLDLSVQNRFYAFRDYHVATLVDGLPNDPSDDDGLADGYTTIQGKTQALTGTLFDVTNVNDPQSADLTDLQAADGYFLDFEGSGEKGLASPVVLGGTAFFTSYLPEGVVSATTCSLAEGSGLLYAINVLNGAAVYPNWDDVGDDSNLTKADRTYTLGGGIPSSAVPIFQEEGITLLIGGGGGATTIDPDLALPRQRTYWGQEE